MSTGINPVYIKGYADSIIVIINTVLVPTLIAVAFLTFFWGIYMYFIKGAADPKAQESGRTFTLYGVIGFVIIFSVWGIVQIFMGTLGLSAGNAPPAPTINISGTVPIGGACYRDSQCSSGYCSGEFSGVCAARTGTSGGGTTSIGAGGGTYTGGSGTNTGIRTNSGGGTYVSGGSGGGTYTGGGAATSISCGTIFRTVCAPGVTSCTTFGFCNDGASSGGTGGSGGSGGSGNGTTNDSCGLVFKTVCTPSQQCVLGWTGYSCEDIPGAGEDSYTCDDYSACNYGSSESCNYDCYDSGSDGDSSIDYENYGDYQY